MVVAQGIRSSYIVINIERCKGCRLCIYACLKGIIGLAPHINKMAYIPAAIIEEKASECTGCTACAMMCPDAAISVFRSRKVANQPIS